MAVKWSAFSAGSAIGATDELVGLQSGVNVRWTGAQLRTYLLGTTTSTLSIAAGKTLTVSKTLTLDGTDATVMTFPSTSATIARTDAGQTFTGASTITSWIANAVDARGVWTAGATWTLPALTLGGTVSGGGQQLNNVIIGTVTPLAGAFTTLSATGALTYGGVTLAASVTGTGSMVLATSPALTTPNIGVATGQSLAQTGFLTTRSATATPAAASAVSGIRFGSDLVGIYWGTGSPNTALTAPKGSLYIRTDGSGIADRLYVNTDSSTAWTNFVTAA